jgi:hydrophobic/amphiphilic exporter-1 (mainly G- bacteria), HAE1 family
MNMKLSVLAVRKAVTFSMIFLITIGFGIFSFTQLKTALFPDIKFPVVVVLTTYTGVAPEDMETLVSRPIEEVVGSVENVTRVTSTSGMGSSAVIIEFDWGTDMDMAEFHVRRNLDLVRGFLPADADDPITFTFDPSLQPILILGLSSPTLSQTDLRRMSEERIEPRLERIEGVAVANTIGGLKRQILVDVDPNALSAISISMAEVIQSLRLENVQFPGGFVEYDEREYSIRTLGTFQSVEQIRNTVVSYQNGSPIYLHNVANVRDWYEEPRGLVRTGRELAVLLFIQKQSDANTVQTVNNVIRNLPAIQNAIGEDMQIVRLYDQSEFINRSITNLSTTAALAFLLTGLVLLFFTHNIRSSLIVAVAVPFSVITTFAVMYLADLTLNIISLAGLALAIGLLVDNSIVVLENIYRMREEGSDRTNAAIDGSQQVTKAITGSTLTTLAVFVPILFVPGIAGVLFDDMVVTICFSLIVSLLVALTLIPLLSSRYLRMTQASVELLRSKREAADSGSTESSKGFAAKLSDVIAVLLIRIGNIHERSLRWAIAHKKLILAGTIVLLVISLVLLGVMGTEFIPETDQSFIRLEVELSRGTSLDVTDQVIRAVEKQIVENVPELLTMTANIGNPGTFMAALQGRGSNFAEFYIGLVPIAQRSRSQQEIQEVIRRRLERIPGIEFKFDQGGMQMASGDVQVKLFGYDLTNLRVLSEQVERIVGEIPGVADVYSSVESEQPELVVAIDRERAALLGLKASTISDAVFSSIQGTVASRYIEQGEEYEILVRLPSEYRRRTDVLENLLVKTPAGIHVPMKAVSEVRQGISPFSIIREDQQRMATVSLTVSGRDLGGVIADVTREVSNLQFPPETRYEISGVAEDMQESFMYLGIAILVAFIVVYMVMAAIFESLVHPFVIIFTVPLAIIGVGWALFITGTTISVTALIGIVMLTGIVVNNGIVLVDFMNRLRDSGMEMIEAVVAATKIRLRPVLMTGLTTVLAMIPLAIGLGESGETWAPMARAVMGGLFVSTAFTVIIIPILYIILVNFTDTVKTKLARREADYVAR